MVRGFVIGCAALALTACAPQRIDSFTAAHSESGNMTYSVNGFTAAGETDPKDAEKYAIGFGARFCKGAAPEIKRIDTHPFHNMVANFLRWQAIVECAPE